MKLNHISKFATAIVVTGIVTFSSCKKDNNVSQPSDPSEIAATMNVTENDAVAETQYDDVFNITMGVQASDAGEEIGIGAGVDVIYTNTTNPDGTNTPDPSSRCFTVSVIPNAPHIFPKTVTVDFGTGCKGRDGKLRKGKIVSIYTGPMSVPGSKISTTFEGYSVDSFKIEGTHTVENTSSSNKKEWTVKVADGKITNTNNGHWKLWNSLKVHTQIQGNGTPYYPLDDVFQISGNATGSTSSGYSWSATITDPLIKKFICHWIVKGTVRISRNDNKAILDYGDGACDNKTVITINGVSQNITLR